MAIVNRKVNLILFVRRSGESRHDYVMPIFLVNVDEPYCDNLFRYREGELPLTIYRTLRQSRHTHTHAHTHTRARAKRLMALWIDTRRFRGVLSQMSEIRSQIEAVSSEFILPR